VKNNGANTGAGVLPLWIHHWLKSDFPLFLTLQILTYTQLLTRSLKLLQFAEYLMAVGRILGVL